MAISQNKRRRVYIRDNNQCVKCGASCPLTIDHIWPRSKGGCDCFINLRTLCQPCNQRKADVPSSERPCQSHLDRPTFSEIRSERAIQEFIGAWDLP